MNTIDLNCDLGESFGNYSIGADEEVIPLITSANIACGYHASDPVIMEKTVKLAKAAGVKAGAHAGYPDLMGFGRRNMKLSYAEARDYTVYQIGALQAFCQSCGTPLVHVKLHGAFYNMAAKDYDLAHAVCEGMSCVSGGLKFMGLPGSMMEQAAGDTGLFFIHEVFADRAYMDDGSLVPRSQPGAMIEDENTAIKRVIRMIIEKKVCTISGNDIPVRADSVCVHGDSPQALMFVKALRKAFSENGIRMN